MRYIIHLDKPEKILGRAYRLIGPFSTLGEALDWAKRFEKVGRDFRGRFEPVSNPQGLLDAAIFEVATPGHNAIFRKRLAAVKA